MNEVYQYALVVIVAAPIAAGLSFLLGMKHIRQVGAATEMAVTGAINARAILLIASVVFFILALSGDRLARCAALVFPLICAFVHCLLLGQRRELRRSRFVAHRS